MTAIMQRENSALQIAAQANQLLEVGAMLVKSGMLPSSIRSPEAAMAIIIKGMELGLPPMAALNGITIIQGKPSVSPQLMLSLINRSGQLEDIEIKTASEGAAVTMRRRGRKPHTACFGPAEARAMELSGKDNYKKQPAVMYQWRAVAACARVVFPDVIDGLYTPEEMGADVQVDEDGAMTVSVQQEVKSDQRTDAEKLSLKDQESIRRHVRQLYAEIKQGGMTERAEQELAEKYGHWKTDINEACDLRVDLICIAESIPLDEPEVVEAEVIAATLITDKQRKALMGQLGRLKIPNTTEARSAFYSWMVGTADGTRTNDLDTDTAQGLIDTLEAMDPAEVEATAAEFKKDARL